MFFQQNKYSTKNLIILFVTDDYAALWYRDGKLLVEYPKNMETYDNNTLVITNLSEKDSSTYNCTINVSTNEKFSIVHQLDVSSAPEGNERIVITPRKSMDVNEHLSLVLGCEVKDRVPKQISWNFKVSWKSEELINQIHQ